MRDSVLSLKEKYMYCLIFVIMHCFMELFPEF